MPIRCRINYGFFNRSLCQQTKNDILISTARRAREIDERLIDLTKEYDQTSIKIGEETNEKNIKHAITVLLEIKKLNEELVKLAIHLEKVGGKNIHEGAKRAAFEATAQSHLAMERIKPLKEALKKMIKN